MEENGIRINKFLSEAGVCSRREADRQVELGNITIDGKVAETGARVLLGQTVLFQGKKVSKEEKEKPSSAPFQYGSYDYSNSQ